MSTRSAPVSFTCCCGGVCFRQRVVDVDGVSLDDVVVSVPCNSLTSRAHPLTDAPAPPPHTGRSRTRTPPVDSTLRTVYADRVRVCVCVRRRVTVSSSVTAAISVSPSNTASTGQTKTASYVLLALTPTHAHTDASVYLASFVSRLHPDVVPRCPRC
jgi:hypothetical protein